MGGGPFGPFRAGHSHADTLSIVARTGDQDLLIDPGTFTYAGDSKWRNLFRGTAAHNTVRVNGLDQADPAGPFGWLNAPQVKVHCWHSDTSVDYLDAESLSRGLRHRRRIVFLKPDYLFILDDIKGDDREGKETDIIQAEQFWHPGGPVTMLAPACFRIAHAGTLVLDSTGSIPEFSEGGEFGWRSLVLGLKKAAPVIVSRRPGQKAVRFGAVLAFAACVDYSELAVSTAGKDVRMALTGARNLSLILPRSGLPRRE